MRAPDNWIQQGKSGRRAGYGATAWSPPAQVFRLLHGVNPNGCESCNVTIFNFNMVLVFQKPLFPERASVRARNFRMKQRHVYTSCGRLE